MQAAIKRNHPSMLTRDVIVLHDNTCLHVAHTILTTLNSMLCKVLGPFTTQPEPVTMRLQWFDPLKNVLKGCKFGVR
jgi:hypothetical protein